MSDWAEIVLPQVLVASRDAGLLALIIGGILWLSKAKLAAAWRHGLWLLVALRLLMPVLPTSGLSWQSWLPEKDLAVFAEASVDAPKRIPVRLASDKSSAAIFSPRPPPPVAATEGEPAALPGDASRGAVMTETSAKPLDPAEKVMTLLSMAALVWLAGVLLCLFAALALLIRFQRRVRRFSVHDHHRQQQIQDQLATLCIGQNISRVPGIVITSAVSAPALTGLRRRSILLSPTVLGQLNEAQLRLVLLHELAHLRRLDLWTGWVLCLLQAAHWFNPLVWWAFHRTRVEAERAADAWVLKRCGQDQRKDYGEMLLQLLESEAPQMRVFPAGVGVLESRRDLKTRLAAIGRFRAGRRRLATVGAFVLMVVLAVVGLTQAPTPGEKVAKVDEVEIEIGNTLVEKIPEIRIVLSDGKTPAAQARLTILGSGGRSMHLKNLQGSANAYPENPTAVADDQGRLKLPKSVPPHYGWVTHPKGWLQVNTVSLERAKQEPLRLHAYSRVEGLLVIDGKPAPDRILEWQGSIRRPGGSNDEWDFWYIDVTSDVQGRYVIDQLVPSDKGYKVHLQDSLTDERSAIPLAIVKTNATQVTTANFDYDEAGRVYVRGRFVTRDGGSLADAGFRFANLHLSDSLGRAAFIAGLKIEAEGSFTSARLLPGRYSLWGDFQFGDENFRISYQAIQIPADAVEHAEAGVFDIGDIKIDYPRKKAAGGAQQLPPGQIEVRVVDALSGIPVEGATIEPWGLSNVGGSQLSWNPGEEKIDPQTGSTDPDGRTVVRFPPSMTREKIKRLNDPTVEAVRLRVGHDDYLEQTVIHRVDGTAGLVELQRGGRLEIIAALPDGEAIEESEFQVQLARGNRNTPDPFQWQWQTLDSGDDRALVHEVIPPGEHLMRCYYRRDDGTLLFSDAEVIEVSLDAPTTLRPTLHLGQPFVGRFEDKVPRPVRKG